VLDESKSSLLLFDIVSTTFIPGKISSAKKVSRLKSIAELRAFYGTVLSLTLLHLQYCPAVRRQLTAQLFHQLRLPTLSLQLCTQAFFIRFFFNTKKINISRMQWGRSGSGIRCLFDPCQLGEHTTSG
jgi:hypothetical protein